MCSGNKFTNRFGFSVSYNEAEYIWPVLEVEEPYQSVNNDDVVLTGK